MNVDKFVEEIAKRTERVVGKHQNDYVKDSLLYCGNCKTPKQVKIKIGGTEKIVFCMCDCKQKAQEEEERRGQEKKRIAEINSLRTQGISDAKIKQHSFKHAEDTQYIQKCKKYVENWDVMFKNNNGLLFWGTPGCGKTFAAGCIANALIDSAVPVFVTSFPRILNSGYDKSAVLSCMRKYDLVVIDDLGAERQSEYALETIYMVIDERYKANKPMIITTNLSFGEMQNPKNVELLRIYDRILGVCVPVCFSEVSRRKREGEDKMKFAKQIFGG